MLGSTLFTLQVIPGRHASCTDNPFISSNADILSCALQTGTLFGVTGKYAKPTLTHKGPFGIREQSA